MLHPVSEFSKVLEVNAFTLMEFIEYEGKDCIKMGVGSDYYEIPPALARFIKCEFVRGADSVGEPIRRALGINKTRFG